MSANVSSHQIIKSLQKVHVQTCASEASNPSRSTLACWFDISRWHLTIICVSLLRDELSTTANLLICRRRHRLVMNCWRLLLDPSISQLLIQLGGKIALFRQRWMMSVAHLHTVFSSVCPEERSLGGISYWLYKCLMSEQQQQLVARCWWRDDTRHTCVPLHCSNWECLVQRAGCIFIYLFMCFKIPFKVKPLKNFEKTARPFLIVIFGTYIFTYNKQNTETLSQWNILHRKQIP